MAHGSWLLRSGSRVCFVLQGFHYCAMYYRQSQPNFEWNKTRSKDTLPYLTKILTITSIVACQLSNTVECCRIYAEDNHCIRIHTLVHSDTHRFKLKLFYVALLRKLYRKVLFIWKTIPFSAFSYSQDTIWPFSHLSIYYRVSTKIVLLISSA